MGEILSASSCGVNHRNGHHQYPLIPPKLRKRKCWMGGAFLLVMFWMEWHHRISFKVDNNMTSIRVVSKEPQQQQPPLLSPEPTTIVENSAAAPYCPNFATTPPPLTWEEIYELEWNGTPAFPVAMIQASSSATATNTSTGTFPTTQFTSHVNELIRLIDIDAMEANCFWKFTLTVPKPFSRPTALSCQGKVRQRMVPWWCLILERLFFHNHANKEWNSTVANQYSANILTTTGERLDPILPTSVSFAVSSEDYYKPPKNQKQQRKKGLAKKPSTSSSPYTCLASSAPNGTFSITNFLELQRMADHTTYPILPWQQRCSKPIWRGSAWIQTSSSSSTTTTTNSTSILDQALRDCPRCRVVEFSHRFPQLLDAKFGDAKNGFFHPSNSHYVHWWKQNTTNGLHVLLPIHYLPAQEYYVHYQTVLVLCGWGAAFRTSIHFSTATAVVLQDCPYQEWYHSWLVPWKHYIPLSNDLATLQETLQWIQENPAKVQAIAMAGREFYQNYLSFQRNYEHFYEWIFRLALQKQNQSMMTTDNEH